MRATGNLGFGHLIRHTAQVLKTGGLSAAALYLLALVPCELFLFYQDLGSSDPISWALLMGVLLLRSLSLTCSLTVFSLHADGQNASLQQMLNQALVHWGRSTKTNIVVITCFGIGLFLSIAMRDIGPRWVVEVIRPIFGIWVLSRLGFACVLAVREPIRAQDALHRSWIMTEGQGWRSLGMCAAMFTLCVTLWSFPREAVLVKILKGDLFFGTLYLIHIVESLPYLVFYAFMVCFHIELEELERRRQPDAPDTFAGPLIS